MQPRPRARGASRPQLRRQHRPPLSTQAQHRSGRSGLSALQALQHQRQRLPRRVACSLRRDPPLRRRPWQQRTRPRQWHHHRSQYSAPARPRRHSQRLQAQRLLLADRLQSSSRLAPARPLPQSLLRWRSRPQLQSRHPRSPSAQLRRERQRRSPMPPRNQTNLFRSSRSEQSERVTSLI